MLGELGNIPTNTLIDMLGIIISSDVLSPNDARELEQIQRELQHRAAQECWRSSAVH